MLLQVYHESVLRITTLVKTQNSNQAARPYRTNYVREYPSSGHIPTSSRIAATSKGVRDAVPD